MHLRRNRLLAGLAIGGLVATLALALPPPYDFSGPWSGTATSRGMSVPLNVQFSPTADPRQFTGSVTLLSTPSPIDCTFDATYKRRLTLRLTCNNGTQSQVSAKLHIATQTLTGSFLIHGHHGKRLARFTLGRAAG